MMIKAVIFDLDGTLTEFNLDVKACRTEVIQNLSEQGIPKELFSLKESAFDMQLKVVNHLGPKTTSKKLAQIQNTIFSIVKKHELLAAQTTKIFPRIPETLRILREMDLNLALCTISSKEASTHILNQFNIKQFFDAIVPRESVTAVKPDPVHLQAVLDALNVNSNEAVFVGDSVKDIICANQLNVLSVGVTTGLSTKAQLISSGAHYIAESANEIPKLVSNLNKLT